MAAARLKASASASKGIPSGPRLRGQAPSRDRRQPFHSVQGKTGHQQKGCEASARVGAQARRGSGEQMWDRFIRIEPPALWELRRANPPWLWRRGAGKLAFRSPGGEGFER